MTEFGYRWSRIADLPDDWPALHSEELDLVHRQWLREKAILRDPQRLQAVQDRLATLWAIETGIIERLYSVDRGVTATLIEVGLGALGTFHRQGALSQEAVLLIDDQKSALEFVFGFVSQKRDLTDSYIKELHQLLTRNQVSTEGIDQFGNPRRIPLLKGTWKKLPNNPTQPNGLVHEYAPPEFVQDEIDQLLRLHQEHRQQGVSTDVEAAWLHHRFTQIHPFQDGNGRVARALATFVFLKDDYLPLVVRDAEHRNDYLDALETADRGDLRPLVALFAGIQQLDTEAAIGVVRSVRGENVVEQARSAAERARLRQAEMDAETDALTDHLVRIAEERLDEIRRELEYQFSEQQVDIEAHVYVDDAYEQLWWNQQTVDIARRHGYPADLGGHRRWVWLRLWLPGLQHTQSNIVVSFHQHGSIGGLKAADAFISASNATGEPGYIEEWSVLPLADEPFEYSTTHREVEEGFRTWLAGVINTGLDQWQRRI